jgi:hypothetical protein
MLVRTVHFGMILYKDQRNAQVFNLLIHLFLPYMFRAFFEPFFRGRCTTSVWFKSRPRRPGPGADTIPRRLEPRRSCTPVSEDGIKDSSKHVR